MSNITLRMTPDECRICSAACVTYLGVPFHAAPKRRDAADDRSALDALFDRLVDARRQLEVTPSGRGVAVKDSRAASAIEVALTEGELTLLTDVIEDILQEHRGFDYDLELHVAPREAVEAVFTKIQKLQTSA